MLSKQTVVQLAIVLFALFVTAAFAVSILVDDAPMCGHHDRDTYDALWDTLTAAGAEIDFTTDVGRTFTSLDNYDMLMIMHHNGCADAGFDSLQRDRIIQYVCGGGDILVMPIGFDDLTPHNELLNDPNWKTGLYYSGPGSYIHTENIANYPPYTDGIEYLHFEVTAKIEAGTPAYPFVWDETGTQIIAAVSYPTSSVYPCSCDAGGRILALADNHTFEAPVVGYIDPMDYKFIVNTMLAMSSVGITLDPCDTPPGVPSGQIDTCLAPYESYTIYGSNLASPMTLNIGGTIVTPDDFAADSTSLTFTAPDLPQGIYSVKLIGENCRFVIGWLQIYCEWVDLKAFAKGCYFIGDTVGFIGENFSVSGAILEIISPDESCTTAVTEFEITSSDSGWFVIPEGIDTASYGYFYVRIINSDIGNYDVAYIMIPCPCPDQDTLFSITESRLKPADTRNPGVTPTPLDSCFILSMGGGTIYYNTSIDSFMSVPGYWPEREPTRPITIKYSDDGGATWATIASNLPNTGSFFWSPPDTGHNYKFIIMATDSFGNIGSDTLDVCVEDFEEPPFTGILRAWPPCEPESLVFTIRDSSIADMPSIVIEYDMLRFTYSDSMYWADETTLVFHPPLPFPDSSVHWVRVSEMTMARSGVRIEPDTLHGLSALFRVDYSPPVITPMSPTCGDSLDSLPDYATFIIRDWTGVEDTSIWVSLNDDSFYIPTSGLDFADSILTIDFAALGIVHDVPEYTICVGAKDTDYPEECQESGYLCCNFLVPVEYDSCFVHPKPFTPNGDDINDYAKFEYPRMYENNGIAYIYTVENEFVRQLENGDVYDSPKGVIYWDGKDAYGRLMENGVYLYIVQDGGKTICKGTVYLAR